ncbi:hypothetical protein Ais01nite_02310 [Asanoa ishikariensis]|uniref:Uncharacterized protein n=1 Tax=Asanoa ishikariensis TaxID=137265 RepID=A0A1H3TL53_9ACTN|nr:hypothetical protein [Asanoa ishikariensis]GIF62196.1 hypothetical protein Ais01nite_02310 [Asanoa ishikariensis]SDZ50956.1 hypothetical protein SAMN05421684_5994 [Asanoa ishikariensis]
MDALHTYAFLVPVSCTMIWAVTRIVLVVIVLRGTRPSERAQVLRAMALLGRSPLAPRCSNQPPPE